MIPAIFDRGWVHPWSRPAEEKRSVRLSAPAVRTVSPRPPHEPEPQADEPFAPVCDYPDQVVFGEPGSIGKRAPDAPVGWPAHYCRCGVGWSNSPLCWNCGRPA